MDSVFIKHNLVTCLKDFLMQQKKLHHTSLLCAGRRKYLFQKALPGSGHRGLLRYLLRSFSCPEQEILRENINSIKNYRTKICPPTHLLALARRVSLDATYGNASALLPASRFWQICIQRLFLCFKKNYRYWLFK